MMAAAMLHPTIYMPSRLARLLIPPVSSRGKAMAPVGDTVVSSAKLAVAWEGGLRGLTAAVPDRGLGWTLSAAVSGGR